MVLQFFSRRLGQARVVAPLHRRLTSATTTTKPLKLDPPFTPVVGENEAAAVAPSAVVYRCLSCHQPLFTSTMLRDFDESTQSPASPRRRLIHASGWPTFLDHFPSAIVMKRILANESIAGSAEAPSPHGNKTKTGLVLRDVADTALTVSIAGGDHRQEQSLRMQPGARAVRNHQLGSRHSMRLLPPVTSAAANKLKEERRKRILGVTQGHCAKCQEPVCIVAQRKGTGTYLVSSPSRLVATLDEDSHLAASKT